MARISLRLPILVLIIAIGAAGCREEGDVQIGSLEFAGVDQVDAGALEDALQTREGSWLPWGRQQYFDRQAFEADLRRIEAFYRDRGFPDARVTSFDVALNDAGDEVDITINISEGEPILVGEIVLEGFEVLPEEARGALRDTLPLRPGAPLDRQSLQAAREGAANALRDRGYAYAEVTAEDVETGPRQRRVVLRAAPGTLAYFGSIEVVGASSVSEQAILQQLTFQPGDLFTREEMRNSQRTLYGLELFEFVNIESLADSTQQSPEVPVRITVAEGDHQKVTLGVGYGTEEQARARLRWDHVNFFGGARHAGFEGKWSSLDRGIRLDYREPFFLFRGFALTLDGQAWQAQEPVYSLDQLGGRITMRRQSALQQFWSVSLINQYQRSEIANEALLDLTVRDELIALGLDPTSGVSGGTLSAVAFDISRNTTSNLLDARSGYVLNGHVEQAGRWLRGSFNYWSATAEGRHYVSAGRRFVLANRLRLGSIDGAGADPANVPFYKRYFLGGSSSIRGWGRYEVGPTSGFGLPIGGHTMLEGSSEVRFSIAGDVGGVLFLDYGNVWADPWDVNLGDLRYAVGPGLRYMTPIGPVRADFGYQVNPIENLRVNGEPQERRWRVHFSIGQAF